jgi:hypothetical protein
MKKRKLQMNVDRVGLCLVHRSASRREFFERFKSPLAPLFQRGERLREFQTQERLRGLQKEKRRHASLIPPLKKGGRGDFAAVEWACSDSNRSDLVSAILLPRRIRHAA